MLLTGNHAVAYGVRDAAAEVIAAYPITPQTQIVEKLAEFVEKGQMRARYVRVESEHSAMAACIAAEACGARSFTATSSQGLLYMSEVVFWAGLGRFPVTMAVVTRTLAPPWSIWNEHTDILSQRDAGWVIMMCENAQEAYDTAIQAFRIAEDERLLQPVMYGFDAFTISHTAEEVDLLEKGDVEGYLPPLDPKKLRVYMDPESPGTFGNLVGPDIMMEMRHSIKEAFERAREVIKDAVKEYERISGRRQAGLIEEYKCRDAEVVIVTMGASSGDAKDAVDALRERGVRAGLVRLRVIRPLPREEILEAVKGAKVVATVDRDYSFGYGGILGGELAGFVKNTMCRFVAGLGGRDLTPEDFQGIALKALDVAEKGEEREEFWWGLKR
ncbi:MAG: pyruvate ferredoxin oxidoreductase [Candidatus Verstraetearchaeota archaeon]|nr:pyruvate ferredoxin oxidoreductase [Candidatus Verstraetearchaeota archaeon]